MNVTMHHIIEATSVVHGLSAEDLTSPNRSRRITRPRQQAMYVARQITDLSFPQIGRRLGGRDHTTILFGVQKIAKRQHDPETRQALERVTSLSLLYAGIIPFKTRRKKDWVFKSHRSA